MSVCSHLAVQKLSLHKEILFSTLHMPSLMRDFFLNALTPIQKCVNYMMNY